MSDATVTAGRGVVFIAFAKLYFMVAGFAIQFILPRMLHSEVLWGNYLLVIGLVSIIDNVLVTATIQAVSKFTAEDERQANAVKRAALKMQLLLGGGIAIVYIAAAPLIARWEKDTSLTTLYQLSAGITFCYAFYAAFVGSLNGLRRFGGQATLDVTFSTLRMSLILGFAFLGWGVFGAVGGFVTAAALILVGSALWVGLPHRGGSFAARKIWRYMVPLFLYTLALNLVMKVDLLLVKRYAAGLSGAVGEEAAKIASAYAGYYGTAQLLAFIPYQAILAVAFVIFPMVSRSTFENDRATTQAYVRQTLRVSLIFVAGVAMVMMANPAALIGVVYKAPYMIGGRALRILSVGMVCFSLFTIINTILNGAGHTRDTIISGLVTLAATAAGNAVLLPRASSLESALWIAAAASTAAMSLGLVLSLIFLYRRFTAWFPIASLLRVGAVTATCLVVGHFVPERSRLFTLMESGFIFGLYFVLLIVLREFKREDLAKIKRIIRRG